MIINPNVVHSMDARIHNSAMNYRSLKLAEHCYQRGVPMYVIIIDGWSRGFEYSQTLHECIQMGYALCIAEPEISRTWQRLDQGLAEMEAKCMARDVASDLPKSF